jgi:quinohemoprotein ethanol dehydrogenase
MGSTNPPRAQQPGRVIAFKLGGKAKLPDAPPAAGPAVDPPGIFDPASVTQGMALYVGNCGMCHGMPGMQSNIITDLRRSRFLNGAAGWRNVVHDGALQSIGMRGFAGELTLQQVEAIRAYVGAASQQLAANQRDGMPER